MNRIIIQCEIEINESISEYDSVIKTHKFVDDILYEIDIPFNNCNDTWSIMVVKSDPRNL